jgi:hypothetical protein
MNIREGYLVVIASEAKQSSPAAPIWIASSRSLSSGRALRADPLAPRNDDGANLFTPKLRPAPNHRGAGNG